jgi:ribosomal protein S18 acetylase RimI-like enzyme
METIRLMQPDDWEKVAQLDTLAFNSYNQQTGKPLSSSQRSRNNLHACLAMNPNGCFVAETDRVCGFIFSRSWGKLGWVGTFAVDPELHGGGTGKELLAAAVHGLEAAGCTTIGLETMPDSPSNVGLYTRFGFNPSYPTLYMTQTPTSFQTSLPVSLLSELEEKDALQYVTALSLATSQGLDFAPEAHNVRRFGWGETPLFGWPQPWGFAIIRTEPMRLGEAQPVCQVVSLVIVPEERHRLGEVLQFIRHYAGEVNAGEVSLPANAIDPDALHMVLENGFRVSRVNLRMIYLKERDRPVGIDLSRWIM